jgi:branched-chain amino acid transport system ATP-binding protein
MEPLLRVEQLGVSYGRVQALQDFSLQLPAGGLVAVLGANGAGKSSLLKVLAGTERAASGRIRFEGRDITHLPTRDRVAQGIALVPEGRRILIGMTVHENLLMGAWCRKDAQRSPELDAIYGRFPNLAERRDMPAGVLSGGEQQMLAMGRALMARPKLLLLDEPSLGLSPLLVAEIFKLVQELNRGGMTIVLVEQNVHTALRVAQQALVLELGRVAAQGEPRQLLQSPLLREAYLGKN